MQIINNQTKKECLSLIINAVGSQKKLGGRLGVSQKTVSKWLNNVANIPVKRAAEMEKIAKEHGIEGVTAKALMPYVDWS